MIETLIACLKQERSKITPVHYPSVELFLDKNGRVNAKLHIENLAQANTIGSLLFTVTSGFVTKEIVNSLMFDMTNTEGVKECLDVWSELNNMKDEGKDKVCINPLQTIIWSEKK